MALAHVRFLLAVLLLGSCSELPGADPIRTPPSRAPIPPGAYQDLHWRFAGPLRGGWATTARGVPGEPEVFYFGAADGGVWKTTDAGRTWNALFQHESVASVGALEIAPGDPKIVYVGTGQVTTRWDIAFGDGLYRSKDGGLTWERRGLSDSEHIGRIWIDPRNPDTLLVAALGHMHGKNDERGVFRSTDGGGTWQRVLFVDSGTGAVDLAADPTKPEVVFAATWQASRPPWQAYFTPMAGPGSGIHRSTDGGVTWTRLAGHGLPDGAIGRIGLAVAPKSGGRRVYATIDVEKAGGLWRSDDGGDAWTRVNGDGGLASDYFSVLVVDPSNPDVVYVTGRSLKRSEDGGKTFRVWRGAPGGDDYHDLWIDPEHPERQITASDQGAVVTVNGGASWSSWYNQPTGQFYRLAADDRFPYWIYSGQQDSGTVRLASRSDYGQLTFRDWEPVGGEERDTDIPFPGDPDLVFGSGLGGRVTRWNARTGQVRTVSPWPISSYGKRPSDARYRSTWLSPLAISPLPPHAMYLGAQVLFRSTDQGERWEAVTQDVTGAVAGTKDCDGDVPVARATACGYGVIFSIAPSPVSADVLWLGTDNGKVLLTRDGGRSFADVTPPEIGDWSKVAQIDASAIDAGTAYAAVDRHRLDDFRPYAYATHDFGRTWRSISTGLDERAYVNVVRADPERAGLLYAGTSRGAAVSFDDGASWQKLELDLPTTGVNDLLVHGRDLVAATEGRGIWILDDVAPLRGFDAATLGSEAVLLPPSKAFRLAPNQNRDTPLPLDEPRAENAAVGAAIDYWLPKAPTGPVTLEIRSPSGEVVQSFRSDGVSARPNARVYFGEEWLQPPAPIHARAGHNRFVWNLRRPRPRAREYEFSIAAVPGADTPELPQGIFVLPGRYEIRLELDGRVLSQPLEVAIDPRSKPSQGALEEQLAFYREVVAALERATDACEEVEKEKAEKSDPGKTLIEVAGELAGLATEVEGSDDRPTAPQLALFREDSARLDRALEERSRSPGNVAAPSGAKR
jgi:photosystem II stability/assembly factor-like uncharacterized protein